MGIVKSQLDIYNPAEYISALGLLTVFSLQHPGTDILSQFQVAGHLGNDNATFIASCDKDLSLEQVSTDLANADVRVDKTANVWRNPRENPQLVAPVILAASSWSVVLDWWLDDLRYKTNGLKLWSGNSNPVDMLRSFIRLGAD